MNTCGACAQHRPAPEWGEHFGTCARGYAAHGLPASPASPHPLTTQGSRCWVERGPGFTPTKEAP